MWIQVRTVDASKSVRIGGLSKLTKMEELRERLVEHFHVEPHRQKLFYRGKQVSQFNTQNAAICFIIAGF